MSLSETSLKKQLLKVKRKSEKYRSIYLLNNFIVIINPHMMKVFKLFKYNLKQMFKKETTFKLKKKKKKTILRIVPSVKNSASHEGRSRFVIATKESEFTSIGSLLA